MPSLSRKKVNWAYGKRRTILLHGNGENTPGKGIGQIKTKYLIFEFWTCLNTWKRSSKNTLWCLLGCSLGDFGTIYYFQITDHTYNTVQIMSLAMVNGLLTSILLETLILVKQITIRLALMTALKMSFLSMLAMELAMNLVDFLIVGEAKLTIVSIPFMLIAGFLTPLPYNYYRLKAYGHACH